ncbi:aTP-dependent DNA helicase RecG [Firmicutes bacterium CAG:822]|nr:aTP-dependent DNA helicase RecG [Firmicutes bacterium CAG:822]
MQLEDIKGIGKTTIKYLNELGIYNIQDLITYYPFRYEITQNTDIHNVNDGDKVVIGGIVENVPTVIHFNRKLNKMSFHLNTGEFITNITIFNRAFLKDKLNVGHAITIIGKYDQKHNSITASDIKFGLIEGTLIEPIYHSSFKINSSKISKIIKSVLDKVKPKDYIPDSLIRKYHFMDKQEAIKIAHNPKDKEKLKKALARLKYEELFMYMMKISYLKKSKKQSDGLSRNISYEQVLEVVDRLPFKLTKDQLKSVKDIYDDLTSSNRMNRLLQGDVGSGKTIVSFIALYINYLAGYQGALMAPTEILASQHYQNFIKLFPNLNVVLLTGKLKAKEKKEAKALIESGKANIIIGTHALISEDVTYHNLGLVITDEQHRFGVAQRGNLKNKGITPDILYMSATPIPRTYALTLYGDMDISSIRTMPNGRKPVKTYVKTNKEIKDVLYMMLDQIKAHHQIYVIAPLIEESDKIDLEDVYKLEEKMKRAFGKVCNVGIMHGKMTPKEKDEVMDEFKQNKIQILISTTVIEVGVDVANATMIVIFDSYRFGLSALHQLRGRVGRNDLDSYCILISDRETKRLEVLTKTNDGFKVSEEDFKLRGGGDIFGVRQSGDMNFKLADIKNDYNLLLRTKEDSETFMKSKEYDDPKYNFIKQAVIQSANLD